MTQPATIYARFSNAEQGKGSSMDRQLRLCEEMAKEHGWEIDASRILRDEGRSAFSGANRKNGGAFYEFEQQAEAGYFQNGHVLIVEHLDRISRQGYDEVLPLLTMLTRNGVTVATVDGNRVYPAFERVPMGPVMEVILKTELAREESKKKADRLAEAWKRKVEKAQASNGSHIAITSTCPAWINVDPATKHMTLNEDRVRVLREIFQLTIDGYGTPAIAQRLNARNEPVWKHREIKSNNGWTVGYLTKIVLNRAVMGEYQPTKKPRGVSIGTPVGSPILNYYPQAIDPITFGKASAARSSRAGTSGSWQITHSNLLSGIAKCSECGGRMSQRATVRKGQLRRDSKGSGRKYPAREDITYLYCFNAWNKVSVEETGEPKCTNTAKIRYEPLERTIVDTIAGYAASNPTAADDKRLRELQVEMAELRRQQEGKQTQADNLARSFAESGSPMMERLALEADAEARELLKTMDAKAKQLDAAYADVEADPSQAWFQRINEIKEQLYSDDEQLRKDARVRMKQFMPKVLSHVSCDRNKETHIILGNNAVGMFIGPQGEVLASGILQEEIIGPDGERNWHPDEEAA